MRKPAFSPNKGTDQPVHMSRLISAFFVCLLDSMVLILQESEFKISSVAFSKSS